MFQSRIAVILMVFAAACGSSPEKKYAEAGSSAVMIDDAVEAPVSGNQRNRETEPSREGNTIEKKIIRNGNMTMQSRNLAASKSRMDSLASVMDGYITSENYNDQPDRHAYHITYRIPAEQFDQFLSALESGSEKIESKSIHANDVTEQYYDIKIRLENERKVEQRYLELLHRANTIKEMLDIEEKLGKVRQEIEAREGRLRLLDNRVSYSTLDVYVYQRKDLQYEPADRDPFGQRLVKALHSGWQGLVDVLLFFLNLWPLWLVAVLIWRFVVWLANRSKNRRE